MGQILQGEDRLADFINGHFTDPASKSNQALPGTSGAKDVRTAVEATRDALKKEREQLMRQEVELLNMV